MTKQSAAIELNSIMEKLHDTLWELDEQNEPYNFPDEALRNASKIFFVVMFDRLYKRIQAGDISLEIACQMAESMGRELREWIKKWTFVDMPDFYKK